ncbi:hypothetical protein FACS1894161_4830 [Spirochaetia bacterium]|nr:hypothetical protein FACS1894161_4830 [Spirochaetia bacterium]
MRNLTMKRSDSVDWEIEEQTPDMNGGISAYGVLTKTGNILGMAL